jgi:hypothetical protein
MCAGQRANRKGTRHSPPNPPSAKPGTSGRSAAVPRFEAARELSKLLAAHKGLPSRASQKTGVAPTMRLAHAP